MYHNGQIVFNIDTGKPCKVGSGGTDWAWDNIPKNTTNFLKVNEKHEICPALPKFADGLSRVLTINGHVYRYSDYRQEQEYDIALPRSIKEAKDLMKKGLIFPAPRRQKDVRD